jgi:hypothetical protein
MDDHNSRFTPFSHIVKHKTRLPEVNERATLSLWATKINLNNLRTSIAEDLELRSLPIGVLAIAMQRKKKKKKKKVVGPLISTA